MATQILRKWLVDAAAPIDDRGVESPGVLDHVLVGINETPESLIAAVQAGALQAAEGRLVLVAVVERYLAAHAGAVAAEAARQRWADTRADLARAAALVDADETVIVAGRLAHVLARECARRRATLAVVAARPHRRLYVSLFGGHEAETLREAPCSVLVARPGWGPHLAERIVVAIDGSPEARAAEAVARPLAERLGRELVPVIGLQDALEPAALRTAREALLDPGSLADAVARASTERSLVVVGARSSAGTAERIVHAAGCSVLVVRHKRGLSEPVGDS